jgi:hypothetical protein
VRVTYCLSLMQFAKPVVFGRKELFKERQKDKVFFSFALKEPP